jgi:DNA-binding transcriptional LysR family regulator
VTYELISTFVNLAKTKSFTKTAEEVFCTQSTASLRIQALEEAYGIKLFHRGGKQVQLTEAGEILLPYAELILSTFQEAKERIDQLKNLSCGKIDLISSHTPGTYILPKFLAEFKNAYPGVAINSDVQYAKTVIQELAEGNRFDLGLVSQPWPTEDPRLHCRYLMEDRLALVVSPTHPFARYREIELKALGQETFLISNSASSLVEYLKSLARDTLDFQKVTIVGNAEAVKKSVKMNLGVSILSEYAIQEEVEKGELVKVKLLDAEARRKIYVLERKKRIPSPATLAFTAMLFERMGEKDYRNYQ